MNLWGYNSTPNSFPLDLREPTKVCFSELVQLVATEKLFLKASPFLPFTMGNEILAKRCNTWLIVDIVFQAFSPKCAGM